MEAELTTDKIGVSLITGFLGSGKTTIVNRLLVAPEMSETLVLVNEFGQVSIDDDLIRHAGESVVELKNGCVCCSLNDDLGTTLRQFVDKRRERELPQFRRVLIETTGLANAGPIVQVIIEDPLVRDDYRLDRVLTTVDAVNGDTSLNLHAESVEQVAVADRLVVTKTDRLTGKRDRRRIETLIARLARLNPRAPVLLSEKGRLDPRALLGTGHDGDRGLAAVDKDRQPPVTCQGHAHTGADHHGQDGKHDETGHRHDRHIRSFSVVRDTPVPFDSLERFWSALEQEAGPNLLRVKGLVHVAERPSTPAVVHGVQTILEDMEWLDEWPSEDRRTRMVFIGWMLDEDRIRNLLDENASRENSGSGHPELRAKIA